MMDKTPEPLRNASTHFVFGQGVTANDLLIPAADLAKMPEEVLKRLLADAKTFSVAGLTIHHFEGHNDLYPTFVMIARFLSRDDYAKEFPPGTAPAAKTYGFYLEEISLYLFAVKYQWVELRNKSSSDLRKRYPPSAKAILALVESAYTAAISDNDTDLVAFIEENTLKHRSALVNLPGFLQLLREQAKDNPILRILIDTYVADLPTDAFLPGMSTPQTASKMPQTSPAGHNGPSRGPEAADRYIPGITSSTGAYSAKDGDDEWQIWRAVRAGRLVVTRREGYGTLLRDAGRLGDTRNRNEDFRFQDGEVLVLQDIQAVNGHGNVVVRNSRGEYGDIRRSLLTTLFGATGGTLRSTLSERSRSPARRTSTGDSLQQHRLKRSRSRSPLTYPEAVIGGFGSARRTGSNARPNLPTATLADRLVKNE
ncbi:hypothetical protein LTR50_006733 [Elasticomyces elasticus]|nr:hypothetical protein LTR50_006733 [Elasticomyces elasticus]